MEIVLLGCGYISYYYGQAFQKYAYIFGVQGCCDIDVGRSEAWADAFGERTYLSFECMLDDPEVDIVVNLTPPTLHHEISLRALRAKKHVYSEKPLALRPDDAMELARIASEMRLQLSSAPCSALTRPVAKLASLLTEIGPVTRINAYGSHCIYVENAKQRHNPHFNYKIELSL